MTIFEAKKQAAVLLEQKSPSVMLDISVLLCHILKCDKTFLLLHNNDQLTEEQKKLFFDCIKKRQSGLSVAYITNHKEFYGYDFYVTPDVLIPKPDTEILVEEAVNSALYISSSENRNNKALKICDMCTGSGCIGISVYLSLKLSPAPDFTLADISEKALNIAARNFNTLIGESAGSWKFVQSNLFENIPESFDLILSNPPYIPASMVNELLEDGRCEPRLALDGDINPADGKATGNDDGLGIIRKLLPQIYAHLEDKGQFLMETGEYNAEETARLAENCGFTNVTILKDLEGQLRVVKGSK